MTDKESILAARDCVSTFKVVLPAIITFEIIMVLVQLVGASSGIIANEARLSYICCYVSLMAASAAALAFMCTHSAELHSGQIRVVTYAYAIFLIVWPLGITVLDATQGYETSLIYACALVLVPALCVMERAHLAVLELLGDAAILAIGFWFYADKVTFAVNFVAYAIIALLVGLAYSRVRMKGYREHIELEELSDIRWQYANQDELTKLLNRRAFVNKMEELTGCDDRENLVIWSFDVNYLKKTNDEFGHAAGDELICAAAQCLVEGLGPEVLVFRIGGDEFAALDTSGQDADDVKDRIAAACARWQGPDAVVLSIAVGSAALADHPGVSLFELEKMADADMYEEKARNHISRVYS